MKKETSEMFGMVFRVNISGNNTNPGVKISIVHGQYVMNIGRDKVYVKAYEKKVFADTEDLKYLCGSPVKIDYPRMEEDIMKKIINGASVDDAVDDVMNELNVELRILADRAGLKKIDYKNEFYF